jgi:predicted metal-dependent phosphoesterase TrpH
LLSVYVGSTGVHAAVRIVAGPTPIPAAGATAAGDLTVVNEKLAFALAVDSPAPYGVPRGALVAIAPVSDGHIGRNRVVFADFIPNNWSAWPNTYHRVEVLERGPQRVRIRAVRDFGAATITTLYTLEAGADQVAVSTTMTNAGTLPLQQLLSGLTLWPNSGFLFAVPGLAGVTEGSAAAALADRVVAYDADWTVTLHAPYLDHIGSGSRDLFRLHTLAPGASDTFDGWLQVGASGDLAAVVAEEIARRHLPAATIQGAVSGADGRPLARAVVVVAKDGKPYAWTLGRDGAYRLSLPAGPYTLYATGPGYSRSADCAVTLAAGSDQRCDFHALEGPGRIEFQVTDSRNGAPLDARLVIRSGEKPVVQFLGRTTFFTELSRRGYADIALAPGKYRFGVSAGGGFVAADAVQELMVTSGKVSAARVGIEPLFDPAAHGWYSADLHHHADQAEAVTPARELARSQLAAGLDVLFVSDHDSTANTGVLQEIAAARGVPFIPGIELSPSWGHFNAYPLNPGAKLAVDTSTASIDMILKEARREGALVVQVNHPFIPYGYFASVAAGVAPGGLNRAFDLVEINSAVAGDDPKVLARIWSLWSEGHHYYLSAGSDTHDVWNEESGKVRTYAHPDGSLDARSFVEALKAGHSYVSYGPLIFPDVMFGTSLPHDAMHPATLGFDLGSVAGLRQAQLVSGGTVVSTRTFAGAPRTSHVDFPVQPRPGGWFALIVEDQAGRKAYTNPVWVQP